MLEGGEKGAWMGKAAPAGVRQLWEDARRRPTGGRREAVGTVLIGWARWVVGGGWWVDPLPMSGFASSCFFCTHLPSLPVIAS